MNQIVVRKPLVALLRYAYAEEFLQLGEESNQLSFVLKQPPIPGLETAVSPVVDTALPHIRTWLFGMHGCMRQLSPADRKQFFAALRAPTRETHCGS